MKQKGYSLECKLSLFKFVAGEHTAVQRATCTTLSKKVVGGHLK